MINTIDVVTQVSVTTFFKIFSILKALQKLHPTANKNQKTKKAVTNIATKFFVLSIFFTFKSNLLAKTKINTKEINPRIRG